MNNKDYQYWYVLDPMCSWCYAFAPEFDKLIATMPYTVRYIMGGLAPDSTKPMDSALAKNIASYWHTIEAQTSVSFNHNFWQENTPIRSSYPACRAVIAASILSPNDTEATAKKMITAIQLAYYQNAKNPALEKTLIECAASIGLDAQQFTTLLSSCQVEEQFDLDLIHTQKLSVGGFPALFLVNNNKAYPVASGYCEASILINNSKAIIDKTKKE